MTSIEAAALLEQLEQRLDEALVGERLEVRDVERRARAAGDVDHLPDRLEQAVALVADVRHERRADGGRLLRDGDELVRRGVGARQVDEPEGEHPRAGLEADPHLAAHRPQLAPRVGAARPPPSTRSRTAPWPIEGTSDSAGRVASSASRYSATVDHGHVSGPGPSSGRRYACRSARRSGATGAGASPSGLITSVVNPCASFGVRKRVLERPERRVRVQVDEARAEDEPAAVDDLARRRGGPAPVARRHEVDRAAASTPTSPRTEAPSPG